MHTIQITILGLMLLLNSSCWAQQDSQFTQYMYNTMSINPAYAGSRGVISVFGVHRVQWVDLDGAPDSNNISFHTPINNSNLGYGVSFSNDVIGPAVESAFAVNVSYSLNLANNYTLAFGLRGSVDVLDIDFSKLDTYDPSDPRFQYNIDNKFSPNIGTGLYLYSENSYIGVSVPNMLETKHFDKSANNQADSFTVKEQLHYYIMAGYVMDIDDNLKFKPSVLTKIVAGAPVQIDVSANFLFNEKFTAGLAYRWSAAFSAMVGFQISDRFSVGFAYDAETNAIANYSSGSYEIFLRFELLKGSKSRMMSPRFF